MMKTTMDTPPTVTYRWGQRGRRARRLLLCLALAGAVVAVLVEPEAPASGRAAS